MTNEQQCDALCCIAQLMSRVNGYIVWIVIPDQNPDNVCSMLTGLGYYRECIFVKSFDDEIKALSIS